MIEEREHSRRGASSAERWLNCPGSIRMSEGRIREATEWAAEGTVAHKVAEDCIRDFKLDPLDFLGKTMESEGFEIEVDEEMVAGAALYQQTIRDDMEGMSFPELRIEHRFHLRAYHEELYGTNDASLGEAMSPLLRVYDFKYGAGKAVQVEDNPQLKIYAVGALEDYPDVEEVELVIVQPRVQHRDGLVRRWRTTPAELRAWMAQEVVPGVHRTEDPTAGLNPKEVWCKWCAGMPVCPALRKRTEEVFDVEFESDGIPAIPAPKLPKVEDLTPEQIGRMLEFKPLAEKMLTSVYAHAKSMLEKDPDAIPGFKLVEGRARRSWNDDFEKKNGRLFQALKQEMYVVGFKSPAQMEKALKEAGEAPTEFLEGLVKLTRGLQVVPDFDARPKFVPAEKMFPVDDDETNYDF